MFISTYAIYISMDIGILTETVSFERYTPLV